jgi:hypothetical protein
MRSGRATVLQDNMLLAIPNRGWALAGLIHTTVLTVIQ